MKFLLTGAMAFVLVGCASVAPNDPTVKILVDLDPASVDRTVIVESIAADRNGWLYVADRVSGNGLRVDPRASAPVPVVIARVEPRDVQGRRVGADPSGLAFDAQGVLHVADSARGALCKVALGADGKAAASVMLVQNALLEGADGMASTAPAGCGWRPTSSTRW